MGFFEPPPPREPPTERREPEWLGPPDNFLPRTFPLSLVLARTDRVAVHVHSGRAYPNGFEFALSLRRREQQRGIGRDQFRSWHEVQETGTIPDHVLRLGIECSDGAKATTFDAHRFFMTDERPSGPVLIQRGGSGGMRTWELGFWVWPLPPPGAFAFVSEWPAEGIALTRREIDADLIRQSAASAEELWSNAGTQPGSGWVSSSRTG